MAATPTPSLGFQNFFQATLTGDITASSTDIPMDNIPNASQGFLVIEPDSATNREVIFYTSKTALKVVCPSAADGRGQDDTTAGAHSTGATVIMAPVAGFFEALQDMKAVADSTVNNRLLALGAAVQMVYQGYSSYDTTNTIMPWDNTIPQNTEGKEFMSLSITPKSATNILVIEVLALTSNGNATQVHTAALFQDSTANALAAHAVFTDASTVVPKPLPLQHVMVAGTTSATTFKVRIGPHQLTTLTFNGNNGANILGAIPKSYIKITEYKAA